MSLFEDVVFYLGRKQAVARLLEESGSDDGEAVRVGVVLSLPVVIGNLRHWVQQADQAEWLAAAVTAVPPTLADDVASLLAADPVSELSNDVLDLLLGEDAPRIVGRVAERAQVDEVTGARLLSITTSAVMAHLADRHRIGPTPADLRHEFAAEAEALSDGGWDPWVAETLADPAALVPLEDWERERTEPADPPRPVEAEVPGPVHAAALHERSLAYPPPESTGRVPRLVDDDAISLDRPPPDRPSIPPRWDDEPTWLPEPRVLLIGAGLLVVLALVAFAFLRGDDEPGGGVVADDVASPTTDPADAGSTDPTDATDVTDSVVDSTDTAAEAATPVGGRQMIEVALADPLGVTAGVGTARFDLDPDSGEVCYEFAVEGVASPYDGHIHLGPAGVKGGIVVDFGVLDGDTSGCIANSPAGTQAILADLGGHYAEFHDAGGVATVRAQLAEPQSVDLTTQADGDEPAGAFARLEPGRLVLTGEVPDQVTVDKYLETFADLDPQSIEVANELVIVPGAPRPSGRIVVDDTLFFEFDSAELIDAESTVLQDLATLFAARPAWRMRVVGHTDDLGTDVYNLELSLQRATAVRDALIAAGVGPDALTVEGAGSTKPIVPNDSIENRKRNRRIEIEVIPA